MKDLAEVCPLSCEGMLHPLSFPVQDGIRFLRIPFPAISSAYLTAAYRKRKIAGLPCFAKITEWVRSALICRWRCPRDTQRERSKQVEIWKGHPSVLPSA